MENLIISKEELKDMKFSSMAEKKELDRKAIKAMAGRFKVSFDFAETFSPMEDYKREDLYKNGSVEYVFVLEDQPDYISLQHVLVVNEKFVLKHWRQDWLYENKELLLYDKDFTWRKKVITEKEAEGTWTQKVFQVDDGPRYQSYGTWVFVDGKATWETEADAPLPRRQRERKDYNVLKRNQRVEITNYGWLMDQDNQKVFREEGKEDQLIVWEKGFEVQNRGEYNVQPAIDYWNKNKNFWADARTIWNEITTEKDLIRCHEVVEGKKMYEHFFELVQKYEGDKYNASEVQKALYQIIQTYLIA